MNRTHVKVAKYRVGKNHYLVIKIYQSAKAHAHSGNALASNAVNVQIQKKQGKHHGK